nr:MAG: RNA-dependent RNA polymerase [Culex leishbunyavirus 2]
MNLGRFNRVQGALGYVKVRDTFSYNPTDDLDPLLPSVQFDSETQITTVSNVTMESHKKALSSASRVGDSLLYTIDDLRDLPHTMVCSMLGGTLEMDLRLTDLFESPPLNKLTPDNYFPGDPELFIEVKTTRGGTAKAFTSGIEQYAFSEFKPKRDTYIACVTVSDRCLTCSECLTFDQEEVDFLILLVRLGHIIQDEARRLGCPALHEEEAPIAIQIPSVDLTGSARTTITESHLAHWDNTFRLKKRLWEILKPRELETRPTHTPCEITLTGHMFDPIWENHPMIPIVGSASELLDLKLSSVVLNPLLSVLLSEIERLSTVEGGSFAHPKYVTVKGNFEEVVQKCKRDYFRGLWGSLVDPKDRLNNVYRYHRGKSSATDQKEVFKSSILQELIDQRADYLKEKDELRLEECDASLGGLVELAYETFPDCYPESHIPRVDGTTYKPLYCDELWSQDARFQQTVLAELNVGRHSAKGNWNRFHVQAVGDYPAILITHGTGQDSHQFYFLVAKLRHKPIGKRFIEAGDSGWYYNTQILSSNTAKISQSLFMYEKLYNLRAFWDDLFGEGERSQSHHFMSILIASDAKQATIDMLSLFRYIYMEQTKPYFSDPAKILAKIPILRTPLQQLICYRMKALCSRHAGGADAEEENSDRFETSSWVDGLPIHSFRECICLSYMHYATSHPVSVGLHTATKITSKILQMESAMPEDMRGIGWNSPKYPGIHEFNLKYVLSLGYQASTFLRKSYPTLDDLMAELSRQCSWHDVAYFSTFKKSTRYHRKSTQSQRCYAFEAVKEMRILDDVQTPYERISALLDMADTAKGRKVSIFTKDQQTGLREIYVLTMPMRICIKFTEILSRIVNSCIPNETLCDASRKRTILDNHQSKVRESCSQLKRDNKSYDQISVLRFSNSADAKTWCQQFCMANFGSYLFGLLKPYGDESASLIRLIMKILNLISNKEIILPDQIPEWFLSHPATHDEDSDFALLRKYLADPSKLGPNGGLKNESNMMQGIPHELSSSLHAMHTIEVGSYLRRVLGSMRSIHNAKGGPVIVGKEVISSMVSSDDSGVIISIPVVHDGSIKAKELIGQISKSVCLLGLGLEHAKTLMGARVSIEKSTVYALSPVFEFNSKFYYNSNEYTADIKFMTACLSSGYHDNLIGRVSESLSSLSACVGEGLTQTLVDHVQYSLNRMHRRLLYNHSDQGTVALKVQSPFLGWVPLMPVGLIGLMNISLIRDFLHARNSPLARLYDSWSLVDDEEFATSMTFSLGSNSQYKRVVEQWNLHKQSIVPLLTVSNDNVIDFLEGKMSQDLKVRVKLMTPGAKIAMSFVSLAKIHSASSYAANRKCMRVPGVEEKLSLVELADYFDGLPPKPQSLIPDNSDIRTMSYILNSSVEVAKTRHPRKRNTLKIKLFPDEETNKVIPILCKHWRNNSTRGFKLTRELRERGFDILDTITDTLSLHGEDPFRLLRLLRNIEDRSKEISYYGPKVSSKSVLTTFPNFLASQWDSKTSMVTTAEGHRVIVHKAQSSEVMDSQKILEAYSKVREGWPFMRELMIRRIDSLMVTNPENERLNKEQLLVALRGSQNRTQGRQWVFPLDLADSMISQFRLNEHTRYVRQMGNWYRLSNLVGDRAEVQALEGAPLPIGVEALRVERCSVITVRVSELSLIMDAKRSQLIVTSLNSPDLKNPLVVYKIPCMSLSRYVFECKQIDRDFGEMTNLAYGAALETDYGSWAGIIQTVNDPTTTALVRASCMHIMNQCMKENALEIMAQQAISAEVPPKDAFYEKYGETIRLPPDAPWTRVEDVVISDYEMDALDAAMEILPGGKAVILEACKRDCVDQGFHSIIQPLWQRMTREEPTTPSEVSAASVDWGFLRGLGFDVGPGGDNLEEEEEEEEDEEVSAGEALRAFDDQIAEFMRDAMDDGLAEVNLDQMLEGIQQNTLDYFGGKAFEIGISPWKRLSNMYKNSLILNARKPRPLRLKEEVYNPTNEGEVWINQGKTYVMEEGGGLRVIDNVDGSWSELWRAALSQLRHVR